jgi:hypothetical protein
MRRLLNLLVVSASLLPAPALAEGSVSFSAGALSGGFLTQQDQYGFGAGKDEYFANLAYYNEVKDLL